VPVIVSKERAGVLEISMSLLELFLLVAELENA